MEKGCLGFVLGGFVALCLVCAGFWSLMVGVSKQNNGLERVQVEAVDGEAYVPSADLSPTNNISATHPKIAELKDIWDVDVKDSTGKVHRYRIYGPPGRDGYLTLRDAEGRRVRIKPVVETWREYNLVPATCARPAPPTGPAPK